MNDSSSTVLLQKLNDDKAIMLIPAIAFVGIMMLTGFVGNLVVCYFYGCKTKTTPTSCFILCLATFDLIMCTFSMPMAIVELRFFYIFPDVTVCKVLRTTNFVCSISSSFILIAIATERYRRVCHPFRRQITVFQAKFICLVSFIISCAFSWPSVIFYTVVNVDVYIPGSEVFQKYDCTIIKNDSLEIYIYAFFVTHTLLFTFGVVALTILYILVGRELIRLKRSRKYEPVEARLSSKPSDFLISENSAPRNLNKNNDKHSNCFNNTNPNKSTMQSNGSKMPSDFLKESSITKKYMANEASIVGAEHTEFREINSARNDENIGHLQLEQTNIPAQHGNECISLEFRETGRIEPTNYTSGTFNNDNVSRANNIKRPRYVYSLNRKMVTSINTVRYNALMLVITLTFIVSYIPYLCLAIYRNFSMVFEINNMTVLQLIFYSIGIRSYYLNSSLNPMIYGLFNSQFRHLFISVFCLRKPNCK